MIVLRIKPVIPGGWQPLLFFVIGLFGYGAQVSLAVGLQKETASRGMLAMYVQIVFASILERIFFHVTPSLLSLIATALILGCAIYVALSKRPEPTPPKIALPDPESNDVDASELEHLRLQSLDFDRSGSGTDDGRTVYSGGTGSPESKLGKSTSEIDLQAIPQKLHG